MRVTLAAELDADLDAVAVAVAQRLFEQQFVVAHAEEVAGVEHDDAGVECRVNRGDTFGAVAGPVCVAHGHQAEADRRRGSKGAKVLCVHRNRVHRDRGAHERPDYPGIADPWHSGRSGVRMA